MRLIETAVGTTAMVLVLGMAPGWPAEPANAPITIRVTSSLDGERGLSRLLSAAGSGNTAEMATMVERNLTGRRWLRLVAGEPEVLVQVHSRSRTETSRSRDKNGRLTINYRYNATAGVSIDRDHTVLEASTTASQSGDSSINDNTNFEQLGKDLAKKVVIRVVAGLDQLRPERPQHGFEHEAKYKFLFKGDGLEITGVEPSSPAAEAGLQVKDRIRGIDNEDGTDQMNERVLSWWVEPVGTRFHLTVERNKQRRPVELVLQPARRWGKAEPKGHEAPAAAARPAARPAQGTAAPSVDLKPGMSTAEVLRALGEPHKKVGFGARSIWSYDGFNVTFVDGKVHDVN